jgi:glycine cleavage system H protein
MEVKKDLFYTKEHEWVKIEGDTATVGITNYAQDTLGDITFVEFISPGEEVAQFAKIGTVESVKAASDIYSPISGKATSINAQVVDAPEIINNSPYEEGWLVRMEVKDAESEIKNLMNPQEYEEYIKSL